MAEAGPQEACGPAQGSLLGQCILACDLPGANRLFWAFMALNLLDVLLAIYGISSRRMEELNPIMDGFVREHWSLAVLFKVGITSAVGLMALWKTELLTIIRYAAWLLAVINLGAIWLIFFDAAL